MARRVLSDPPVIAPSFRAPEPHRVQPEHTGVPRGYVVLAEDDDDLRALIAEGLESRGFDVEAMSDGTELSEYLAQVARDERCPPDVLISDLHMPGCTGLEVLQKLRRDDWCTRFVLISAFMDLAVAEEALRSGADRVIQKPLDLDSLCDLTEALAD